MTRCRAIIIAHLHVAIVCNIKLPNNHNGMLFD